MMTLKAFSTPFGAHILLLLTLTLQPVAPSPTQVLLDLGAIGEAAYRSSPQDEGPPLASEVNTKVTLFEVPEALEERSPSAGARQGERLLHPARSTSSGEGQGDPGDWTQGEEMPERLTTWTEDPDPLRDSDRITMWEIVTSNVTPQSSKDSSTTPETPKRPNYRILRPIPDADVIVEEVHQQPPKTEKEEGEKTKEEEEDEEETRKEKVSGEEISKRIANVEPGEEVFARPETPSSLLVASRGDNFSARRKPVGHERLVAEHKAAGGLHFENDVDYGSDADPYYYWDIQGDADDYSESELPPRGVHTPGGSPFLRPANVGTRIPPTPQFPSPQPQRPTFIPNNPPTLPVHPKPVDGFRPPGIPPVIPLALMPALRERLSQMMAQGQQTISPDMIHRLVQQLQNTDPLRQGPPSSQNYPSANNQGQVAHLRPQSAPGVFEEPPRPQQSSQILRDSIMGYPVDTGAPGSNVETFNIVITKDMTGGQKKPTVQYYPDAKVESILLNTTIDSVTDIASLKKVVSNAVSSSVRNEPVNLQEALAQVVEVPGQEPKINVLNSTIPDLNELEDTINNLLGSSVVYKEDQSSNTAVGHIPNYNGSVVNNLLNKTVGVQNLHVNSTSKTNVVNIFIINILGDEEPIGPRPAMPHLDRDNQGSSASPADTHSSSLLRPASNKIPLRSSLPPLNSDQKVNHSSTSSQHIAQSSSQTEMLNESRPPSVFPPRDPSGAEQEGGSSLHIPAKTDPNINSGGINLNKNDVLNLLPDFVKATTIPPVVPLYDTSVHEVLGQKPSVLGLLPSSLFDVSSPKRHGLGNQTVGGVIRKRPIADLTAYFGVNRSPVVATEEDIGKQQIPRHNNPHPSSQTNHAPNTSHPVAVNRVQLVESTNETQSSSPDQGPSPYHSAKNDNRLNNPPVPAFGSARRPNIGQSPYQPFTIVNPERPHQGVQNINLFDIANSNQRANGGTSASTAQTSSQQKKNQVQAGQKKQPAKQEHKVQENVRSQVEGIVPATKAPVPATDQSSSSVDMDKLMKAVAIGALPSGIALATALWPYWAPAVLGKRRRRDVLPPDDGVEARSEISQDWLSILLGTRYSQGGTVNWKGHEGVKFPIPGMGDGKNNVANGAQELEPDTTTDTSQLNHKTPLPSIPVATESITETTKEEDVTTSLETSQETIIQGNKESTSSGIPNDKPVSQSSNLNDQTFTMSTTMPLTEVEESMDSSEITETTKNPVSMAFTEPLRNEDDSTELEPTPEEALKTTISSAAMIESTLESHTTKVDDDQESTPPEDNEEDISSTTVKRSTKEPVTETMPTTGREGTGTISQIGGSYTSSDSVFSKPLIVLDGATTKAQSGNENAKNGNDVALVSNFLYSTLNDWNDENGDSKVTDKTEPQQVSDTTEGFPHNDLIELDINTQPVSQMVSGVTNSPIVFINGVPIISPNVPKTAKPLGTSGVQRPIYTVQTRRPSIQGASISRVPVRNSVTSYLPLSSSSSSSVSSATPSLSNFSPSTSHSSSPTSYSTFSALLSSASSSATATQKPVVFINNQAVTMNDLILKSSSFLPTTKRPFIRPTRRPSGAATPVLTTWFNRGGPNQGVTTSEFSRLPANVITRTTSTESLGSGTTIFSSNTPRITTTVRPRVTTARPRITSLRPRRTTLGPITTTLRPKATVTRPTVQTTQPKTISSTPRPTAAEIRTTTINPGGTTKKPTTKPPTPSGLATRLPGRVGTTTKATTNATTTTTPPTIVATTEPPVLFGMTSKQLSRAASFVGSVTVYGAAALMPLWLPIVLGKRRRRRDLGSEDDLELIQTLEAIHELPKLEKETEVEDPTKDTLIGSPLSSHPENEKPEHLIEEEFGSKTGIKAARFSGQLKKTVQFLKDLDKKESRA